MKVVFHGATRTVTGSLHEVQVAGKRVLLDCGLFQGPRALAAKINTTFDFDPKTVDAVFLSHGHSDHCGNIPNLVKQGFKGPVYCTRATAAVSTLMLLDSAKIQEEDARYLNQKTDKTWAGRIEPLYTHVDAEETIRRFRPIEYDAPLDLGGYTMEFHNSGHVLGSAAMLLTEKGANGARGGRVMFTGDVGRPGSPILRDPEPFTQADVLITECTYGGRTHPPIEQVPNDLARIIGETAARGGWVILPAFALGRTQSLIYELHQLRNQKRIPETLPIHVDSPLANRLTEVFRQFSGLWDEETRGMFQPFDFPGLHYVQSQAASQAINNKPGPGIIMASSGMCEAGRILHHLKHHIRDPRTTVLLAGYQAENTLGRKLQEKWKEVPILGDMIPLNAHVETMDALSAHGDGKELVDFVEPMVGAGPRVYLVHGEMASLVAHQAALKAAGFGTVEIASRGDVVEC